MCCWISDCEYLEGFGYCRTIVYSRVYITVAGRERNDNSICVKILFLLFWSTALTENGVSSPSRVHGSRGVHGYQRCGYALYWCSDKSSSVLVRITCQTLGQQCCHNMRARRSVSYCTRSHMHALAAPPPGRLPVAPSRPLGRRAPVLPLT